MTAASDNSRLNPIIPLKRYFVSKIVRDTSVIITLIVEKAKLLCHKSADDLTDMQTIVTRVVGIVT